MDTKELIAALAADARRPAVPLSYAWWGATGIAIVLAAVVFQMALGVRADIAPAMETPRFLFKFVVTIALTGSAFAAIRALSRPGAGWRGPAFALATVPVLLAAAAVVELLLLPPEIWAAKAIGMNNLVCLIYIPLIGLGPLLIFVATVGYGAATRPMMAGAVAGLLAGGISATFYAAHCTDDSPLFVVVWYTIAVAILALVGAAAARWFARW